LFPLGKYKLSLDPWRIPLVEEEYLEESADIGSSDIETSVWKPLEGTPSFNTKVVFVDGVRRTEALIYIEDDEGNLRRGAFVSVAAGALFIEHGKLNDIRDSLCNCAVKRYLFLEKDLNTEKEYFELSSMRIKFKIKKIEGEISPNVNREMSNLEVLVAEKTLKEVKSELILTDGTVHYSAVLKDLPFVGYVKKHKRMYIPSEKTYILRELKRGQRTPIILIHSQPTMDSRESSNLDKFTWYVRISEDEGLGGICRLEVSAGLGLEKAKKIADITAWLIPQFASNEFTDKRAPQNLLPIKHLENSLRRRLGSQSLIRRTLMRDLFMT